VFCLEQDVIGFVFVQKIQDIRSVVSLCKSLDVPCKVISVPQGRIAAFASNGGPGIEAAARIFRHKAWNREAKRIKADRILTAHTRDDLLETILMRILRGSGPAGLAPMKRSKGRLLRPLLDVTRQDLIGYLEEKGLSYQTDSTNTEIIYLRNRIRNRLIPLLDEFFPQWRKSLLALAETQALTAGFLLEEVKKNFPWEILPDGKTSHEGCHALRIREDDFRKAHPVLREEAVFKAVNLLADLSPEISRYKNPKCPRRSAVRQAVARRKQAAVQDLGPVRLDRRNGFIIISPSPRSRAERGFSMLIKEPGSYILRKNVTGLVKDLNIRVEPGLFPLVFRNYHNGDCILKGGHMRRFSDILDINARSRYTGIITVCDSKGPAALIASGGHLCNDHGKNLLVISRDNPDAHEAGNECYFMVSEMN